MTASGSKPSIPRGLNPQQRETVRTTEGAVLVLAGAGTGKTRTVTERIAYLLRSGIKPESILAVTFTNKAAAEMKERVRACARSSGDLSKMIISTFHSLCVRILRRDAESLGYRKGFSIADQGEQVGLIRKAARHIRGGAGVKPEDMLFEIGRLKNAGIGPDEYRRRAIDDWEQTLASVYRRYQEMLRALNAFDFDDLLIKTVELLESHENSRQYWTRRFKYIMVDEFQDTNAIQCRLVELLASRWGNLCVVGDDDQSIYGWRGAVAENILHFHKRFKDTKVIRLEENYRSVNTILKAANALIAHNESRCEKTLWSSLGEGERIRILAAEDQQDEAERVVTEIKKRTMDGGRASDFAIILRTNAQTRPFEEEMRQAHLPYVVVGGQSFFDRKEVRDMLSYLAAVANPFYDAPLLRIINTPARGIGEKTIEALAVYAQREGVSVGQALSRAASVEGLSEKARTACMGFAGLLAGWRKAANGKGLRNLVDKIVAESGYQDEIDHLYDDPLDRAARYNMALEVGDSLRAYLDREAKADLSGFVQDAMLMGRDDQSEKDRERSRDAVKIITAHSAKGLEFPSVYICGFEEGLIPHRNHEESNTLDEERRLCYVALTRAQQELTLSYCRGRLVRGKREARAASRFLDELPGDLLNRCDEQLSRQGTLDAIRAYRERLEAAQDG